MIFYIIAHILKYVNMFSEIFIKIIQLSTRIESCICYSVPKRYAAISKPPPTYTVTIILYLRNIPHKVIEYLDFSCFVYLVFFIDINFVDEIS